MCLIRCMCMRVYVYKKLKENNYNICLSIDGELTGVFNFLFNFLHFNNPHEY